MAFILKNGGVGRAIRTLLFGQNERAENAECELPIAAREGRSALQFWFSPVYSAFRNSHSAFSAGMSVALSARRQPINRMFLVGLATRGLWLAWLRYL
jgi:hypothetical protein